MVRTQRPITSGEAATLVSVGGPGGIGVPSGRNPSPASGRFASRLRWPLIFDVGNPTEVASLATQLIIGTVRAVCIPWRTPPSSQSQTLPSNEPFSKNQSEPVFHKLPASQLRRVVGLPPIRFALLPL